MWEKTVQPDRPQIAVWRIRIACCITKATNAHSEYVILIVFHYKNGNTNAPQCYVIRTLPVLFSFGFYSTVVRHVGGGGTAV